MGIWPPFFADEDDKVKDDGPPNRRTETYHVPIKKRVRERFIGKRVNVVKVNNCHNICSKESCENHAPP